MTFEEQMIMTNVAFNDMKQAYKELSIQLDKTQKSSEQVLAMLKSNLCQRCNGECEVTGGTKECDNCENCGTVPHEPEQ